VCITEEYSAGRMSVDYWALTLIIILTLTLTLILTLNCYNAYPMAPSKLHSSPAGYVLSCACRYSGGAGHAVYMDARDRRC